VRRTALPNTQVRLSEPHTSFQPEGRTARRKPAVIGHRCHRRFAERLTNTVAGDRRVWVRDLFRYRSAPVGPSTVVAGHHRSDRVGVPRRLIAAVRPQPGGPWPRKGIRVESSPRIQPMNRKVAATTSVLAIAGIALVAAATAMSARLPTRLAKDETN